VKFRTFGKTPIRASEIGFGCWTVGTDWWGKRYWRDDVKLLRTAFGLGITFYDTADTYGNGFGEEILALAFEGLRKEITIATKFGSDFYTYGHMRRGHGELPQDFSPKYARFACEESLKRLKTDFIDLYQLHNPRLGTVQRDDLFGELEKLKEEGKILSYGVALGPALGWKDEGLTALRSRQIAALQIIFNVLEQDPGREFFPDARRQGVGIMVRVPHASGLLEGTYTPETTFPANDHRAHRFHEDPNWLVNGLKKVEKLKFLTEEKKTTIGQMALKFILAEPSVTTVLPNIYNEEQLREFSAAPECPDLTPAELARIADLYEHNFYLDPQAAEAQQAR
jgi:aryl-alcohol dehydrogenase-like predicted oxidoreductase